jgi:NADPH-dependent 2,4-dienoyl-CoA reductase/sulfur reductase-like enzyme/rhodanese-related sulfurtransferase
MAKKVIIIGGNACGMKTASRLRRIDPQAEITVIEKGQNLSYAACGFPMYIAGMVPEVKNLMDTPLGIVRDWAFFKGVKGVTVLTRTEARRIDRKAKIVAAVDLETGAAVDLPYDKLVIATGAAPLIPPLEGTDLQGVFTLSTLTEAVAIKEYIGLRKPRCAVIIGGGLIGLEVAESLVQQGIAVTIIERLPTLLPALLDADMALLLQKYLRSQNITILTGTAAQRFEDDGEGRVARIVTEQGRLPVDMVIVSIGVRPEIALAREAGLKLGQTGALAVNEQLQTSDPDIYAGGDCVENRHLVSCLPVFAPMGSTANKHGRVIADTISGMFAAFPGILGTAVCKLFASTVGRTGLTEREARQLGHNVESVIVPGPDKPHFYAGAQPIIIKLIAEKLTGRLLGAQMFGPGDVAKRLDIAVSCLTFVATATQASRLDLAYAPPFSPAMDNFITAAGVLENKLQGLARGISPLVVKEKMDRGDDFIFLDVRSPQEFQQQHIAHPAVRHLPLGKLRAEASAMPQHKEIIITCKTSLRAYEAQRILDAAGFTHVAFMDGGFSAWPFETVSAY